MTVVVDGESFKIAISDEFEDASLSVIKEKVRQKTLDRQQKHAELLKLAQELGYDLNLNENSKKQEPKNSELEPQEEVNQNNKPQQPAPAPTQSSGGKIVQRKSRRESKKFEGMSEKEVQEALERLDKRSKIESQQEFDPPPPGAATSRPPLRMPQSIEIKVDTPEGKKVVSVPAPTETSKKSQIVEGRGGVPVKIPKSTHSRVGDTNIKITKFSDADLQNVSKNYAATGHHFSNCRYCNGTGINRVSKKECPKCDGRGITY